MTNKHNYSVVRVPKGSNLDKDTAYLIGRLINADSSDFKPIFLTVAFSGQSALWVSIDTTDAIHSSCITTAIKNGLCWKIEKRPKPGRTPICPHCYTMCANESILEKHIKDEHSTVHHTLVSMQDAFEELDVISAISSKNLMRDILILTGHRRSDAEEFLGMSRDIHPMELSQAEWEAENARAAAFIPDTPDTTWEAKQ